jgi:putative cell wall-binding protein
MKRSPILLASFVALEIGLVPSAAGASGLVVPSLTVSVRAVTEAYVTRFTLTARNPDTGQIVPVWVKLSNQPADAADNDYYVDYAAGTAARGTYGPDGWTDLPPDAAGTPFLVDGPTPVAVLAYDNEALGDPDGNDTGQAIGIAVAVDEPGSVPGPWVAVPEIPVVPATLSASPMTVLAGVPTAVTFRLTDAAGAPLAGYSVQPEVASTPTGVTNGQGTVTLTVDPGSPGPLAFWAEDQADNGHNLAGIMYAGAYATVTLNAVTALPKPKPHPNPQPKPKPHPTPTPSPKPSPAPTPPPSPKPIAPLVLLARNNLPYDGIVGSVLAVRDKAPLYLTDSRFLSTDTAAALKAIGCRHVILLGGKGAITPRVVRALRAAGIATRRLWGADRYGTAAQVALAEGDPSGVAVVASGVHTASLLAAAGMAAAHGWILLLAAPTGLPVEERAVLGRDRVRRVFVVGSAPGLAQAASEIRAAGIAVERVAGTTPYEAEANWVKATHMHPAVLYITVLGDILDTIPMLPAVAAHRSVILSMPASAPLPSALSDTLKSLAAGVRQVVPLDRTDPFTAGLLAAVHRLFGGTR